ncbi:MAG: HNH endonuclease signature motif containing protein [Solirubrobacteraceae bacterium]
MPWRPPFSESDLRAAVEQSMTWAGTLRLLGYEAKGANYRTLQRWAEVWGIATDHFDPNAARRAASAARVRPLSEVMVENSSYRRGQLKERLFAESLKQRTCEMCGQGEIWNGRRMALVLDHINGVSNDHRLENLQVVCPNCAATLDTHCGRNLPRIRTCPGCGESFAPRTMQHRYCSPTCWGTVYSERKRGVAQPHLRKVGRPPTSS